MLHRIALGLFCLTLGSGLICLTIANIARAWDTGAQGLPLLNLIGLALGLAGMGASADLLGRSRHAGAKTNGIANSIWASLEHLNKYDITER
jgi:hypothetical protein